MANAFDYITNNATEGKANLTTIKSLRMKKGSPFSKIEKKVDYVDVKIGMDYLNEVQHAQDASGAYPNYQLTKVWHEVYNKFFNVHKTNPNAYYLRIINPMVATDNTQQTKTTWIADGGVVDYTTVEPYLYANDKPSVPQDNAKQLKEGVDKDKQVMFNLISADNIISFTQNDKTWVK